MESLCYQSLGLDLLGDFRFGLYGFESIRLQWPMGACSCDRACVLSPWYDTEIYLCATKKSMTEPINSLRPLRSYELLWLSFIWFICTAVHVQLCSQFWARTASSGSYSSGILSIPWRIPSFSSATTFVSASWGTPRLRNRTTRKKPEITIKLSNYDTMWILCLLICLMAIFVKLDYLYLTHNGYDYRILYYVARFILSWSEIKFQMKTDIRLEYNFYLLLI